MHVPDRAAADRRFSPQLLVNRREPLRYFGEAAPQAARALAYGTLAWRDRKTLSLLRSNDHRLHGGTSPIGATLGCLPLCLRLQEIEPRSSFEPDLTQEVLVTVAMEHQHGLGVLRLPRNIVGANHDALSIAAHEQHLGVAIETRQLIGVARRLAVVDGEGERHLGDRIHGLLGTGGDGLSAHTASAAEGCNSDAHHFSCPSSELRNFDSRRSEQTGVGSAGTPALAAIRRSDVTSAELRPKQPSVLSAGRLLPSRSDSQYRTPRACRAPRTARPLRRVVDPILIQTLIPVRAALRALPFFVMLTFGSSYAFGQQLTCYVIARGDTAAGLAKQLTGSALNRRQPGFQIVDPATATFIRKSEYDIIRSGWYACVAPVHRPPLGPALQQPAIPQSQAATEHDILRWASFVFLGAAGLVCMWVVREYVTERRARLDVMRAFATIFVSEFERPLIRRRADESPVKARLRLAPARRRLEVLLAPAEGRTYPNLFDHRKNVEYDVDRVLGLLKDEPFISAPLYARGRWVVIPFHFETNR